MWQSKFSISYKNYTDTVWFGASNSGGPGFQNGLDILDTGAYIKPLEIRSHDNKIAAQYPRKCGNLERNIINFESGVTIPFFITYNEDSIESQPFYLHWDSVDYKFSTKYWKLTSAIVKIGQGWFEYVDNSYEVLFGILTNGKNYFYEKDSIAIYVEEHTPGCGYGFSFFVELYFEPQNTGVQYNDKDFKAINIFPNPFENNFTIELPNYFSGNCIITNVSGQTVKTLNITNAKHINFELGNEIKSGIYFLSINSLDGFTYRTKLLKQ